MFRGLKYQLLGNKQEWTVAFMPSSCAPWMHRTDQCWKLDTEVDGGLA